LEPLVVRRHDEAWSVVAGHRRYRALRALAEAGEIATDAPVGCSVLHDDVDSTEAALAENVVRVAMHPADQVVAFKRLADEGATVEDIANRFGLPQSTVQRRMRLGQLARPILEAYRDGRILEEAARAYATTPDTERQMQVWQQIESDESYGGGQHYANRILRHLQEERLRSDSPLAQFVGTDEYAKAGGSSEQTLFQDYAVLQDAGLALRLAREKLAAAADAVLAEGWKWVETSADQDTWKFRQSCRQTYPQRHRREPTPEEQAVLDRIEALGNKWEAEGLDYDELNPEEQREWDEASEASEAADAVDAAVEQRTFTPAQKAASGVLIGIGHGGQLERIEGLVRKGDPMPGEAPATTSGTATTSTAHTGEQPPPKPKGYSQKLKDNIMNLRNGVLRAVLHEQPEVAMDALVFSMVLALHTGASHYDGNGRGFYPGLPLAVERKHNPRLGVPDGSDEIKAYLEHPAWHPPFIDPQLSIGEMFEAYRALPPDSKALVTSAVVTRLLVDHPGGDDAVYDMHAAIAAETQPRWADRLLAVDENVWSVDVIWSKLRKDQIIDECRPYLGDEWAAGAADMKKGQLALDATKRMRAHPGWLPKGFDAARPERES
ncbi:MAG: ParB/RepB/Spo0J family partition protein, partial [Deltaproteobacteria bacterium]|nr:ParB/RepB/Spo0J family partition protein [Deltaproteobacteria bacterium]